MSKNSTNSVIEINTNVKLPHINSSDENMVLNKSFFTNICDNTYLFIQYTSSVSYKSIIIAINVSSIYLLWIFLHYTAAHAYVKLCVPDSFYGFIISPLLTSAPHCQGLRWVIYNGGNIINNMWIILGTWICSNILLFTHIDKK